MAAKAETYIKRKNNLDCVFSDSRYQGSLFCFFFFFYNIITGLSPLFFVSSNSITFLYNLIAVKSVNLFAGLKCKYYSLQPRQNILTATEQYTTKTSMTIVLFGCYAYQIAGSCPENFILVLEIITI